MQNYSLLLTYNKDTKILDLLNNETKNEKIYTAKEVEKISIDEPFEITDRLDQRIKDTVRFDDFPLLGYFYKKEGEDYISIAIVNQKGGVGKTTTVLNLGYALSEIGKEVLLIDFDPQASLTAALGCNVEDKANIQILMALAIALSFPININSISLGCISKIRIKSYV